MKTEYFYRKLNARKETSEKFDAILKHIKPTPAALDLLDYILDRFIDIEKIPIPKKSKIQESEQ